MFESYVREPVAAARRGRRRRELSVYLGLAMLLAAASLVAVNSRDDRGGAASKFPRVLVPGAGGVCTSPPNGALFSGADGGVQIKVCISQEGTINQIEYPDTAGGHSQIAFDGYCIGDFADDGNGGWYKDYSPGSGVPSWGWGPATLTQTAPEIFSMTRDTNDGKFRLTEFIKVNIQPRSVFVGMTVKNLDSVTHTKMLAFREVAPAIDGNAADDQYNEFGRTASGTGATGQAFQGPTVGSNSLLFGRNESGAIVRTTTVNSFQAQGASCFDYLLDPPGYVTGGNRVFVGYILDEVSIAPGASANMGKYVYRML